MESAAKGRARERDTQIAPRGSEGVGHRVPVSILKWLPSLCQRTLSLPLCACAAWRSPLTHSLTWRAAEATINRVLAAALATGWTGPELVWSGHDSEKRAPAFPARARAGRLPWSRAPAGRHIPMLDGRLHPAGSMPPLNQKMDRSPFHQPTQAGARPIREVGAVVICCVALRRCLHILATGHASLFVAALARRTA